MNQAVDLTKGDPRKLILRFFWPLLLASLLQQVYTVADLVIIGKGLGDDQVAAVGNMGTLCFFVIGFSIGLTMGFGILIALYFGAEDIPKLKRAVASSVLLSIIISALLTLFSMVFLKRVLLSLQTQPEILGDSLTYGYILFGGLTITIAYNLCASILRSLGDSKTPFVAVLITTIVNIILNCVSIFIMHTGVEGPAYATIISQLISAVICYAKLRKISIIHLSVSDFKGNGRIWLLLLKNGIPMAIMNSITAIGCMVVQYFVNGMGVAATSAYAAGTKLTNLMMMPSMTAGQAATSFAGQNLGAGEYDRIRQGVRVCLGIALISYVTLGLSMVVIPKILASFMLNGAETIGLACSYERIAGASMIIVDVMVVLRCSCQGIGRPLMPMVSGVMEMVCRVMTMVLLTGAVGFVVTAYAEIAAWTGALLINGTAYFYYMRKLGRT